MSTFLCISFIIASFGTSLNPCPGQTSAHITCNINDDHSICAGINKESECISKLKAIEWINIIGCDSINIKCDATDICHYKSLSFSNPIKNCLLKKCQNQYIKCSETTSITQQYLLSESFKTVLFDSIPKTPKLLIPSIIIISIFAILISIKCCSPKKQQYKFQKISLDDIEQEMWD
mmetsp:Transcript_82804/g.101506  ORF Transcript_82804/g.101506 Transcript_82804/m.101506 type:complete len:177 (+) Transcript_82804:101-631(+)